MTPNSKRKIIHYWRRHVRPILVLVLVFTSFRSIAVDWNDVPTGSMKPTIWEGDRIFVNKLAYGLKVPYTTLHLAQWSGPKRGEIVVFYSPEPPHIRLVKRVIGLPGDRISIKDGRMTLNGVRVEYTRISDADAPRMIGAARHDVFDFYTEHLPGGQSHVVVFNAHANPAQAKRDVAEFTVPPGHYFMMGDNRDNSRDCRYFGGTSPDQGCVERSQVLGRSTRTMFSLDRDDWYLPRKDRWFKGLE